MNTFNKKCLLLPLMLVATHGYAGGNDDPFLVMGKVDQLETRNTEGEDPTVLEGQLWMGHDLSKLWFKVDAERVDGDYEELELQALYSRAIAPFWNLQLGARRDVKSVPDRNWGVVTLQGLAPYEFEVEASLFLGESGRSGVRLAAEYELMLTQRLVLSPELELNAYGHNDPDIGMGAGLADTQIGLRLRYEIRREFAPYVGVNWNKRYGNTADFAATEGGDIEDSQWVVGVRAWF